MVSNAIVKAAGLSNLQKRVLVGAGLTAIPFYLKAKTDLGKDGNHLSGKEIANEPRQMMSLSTEKESFYIKVYFLVASLALAWAQLLLKIIYRPKRYF